MHRTAHPLHGVDSTQLADLIEVTRRLGAMSALKARGEAVGDRYRALARALNSDSAPTAAQGALIAWAVDVSDRAEWTPPTPTRGPLHLLALAWVSRARWVSKARWTFALLLVIGALGGAGQLAYEGAQGWQQSRAQARAEAIARAQRADLERASALLAAWPDRDGAGAAAATIERLYQQASARVNAAVGVERPDGAPDRPYGNARLSTAVGDLRAQATRWLELGLQSERGSSLAVPAAWRGVAFDIEQRLQQAFASADLQAAQFGLRERQRLHSLLENIAARATPDDVDDPAAAALEAARRATDAALTRGDLAGAERALRAEIEWVALITSSYTLRIIDRAGARSGVWRHPQGQPEVRAYYLIVEAIDASGRPLNLPVLSDETQTRRTVSQFGVRVPQALYEAVRDEKQRSGRIVEREVGGKRAGALEPEFTIATETGLITEW